MHMEGNSVLEPEIRQWFEKHQGKEETDRMEAEGAFSAAGWAREKGLSGRDPGHEGCLSYEELDAEWSRQYAEVCQKQNLAMSALKQRHLAGSAAMTLTGKVPETSWLRRIWSGLLRYTRKDPAGKIEVEVIAPVEILGRAAHEVDSVLDQFGGTIVLHSTFEFDGQNAHAFLKKHVLTASNPKFLVVAPNPPDHHNCMQRLISELLNNGPRKVFALGEFRLFFVPLALVIPPTNPHPSVAKLVTPDLHDRTFLVVLAPKSFALPPPPPKEYGPDGREWTEDWGIVDAKMPQQSQPHQSQSNPPPLHNPHQYQKPQSQSQQPLHPHQSQSHPPLPPHPNSRLPSPQLPQFQPQSQLQQLHSIPSAPLHPSSYTYLQSQPPPFPYQLESHHQQSHPPQHPDPHPQPPSSHFSGRAISTLPQSQPSAPASGSYRPVGVQAAPQPPYVPLRPGPPADVEAMPLMGRGGALLDPIETMAKNIALGHLKRDDPAKYDNLMVFAENDEAIAGHAALDRLKKADPVAYNEVMANAQKFVSLFSPAVSSQPQPRVDPRRAGGVRRGSGGGSTAGGAV
ncbi:hypothetical protein BDK51DRAFT_25601 [Blyttiomyces helicus]|uniref:Uncharacterized protein n=1 Tax=Blyttiomyces helicus TaxID=388810 RepID=A0A4P9WG98_9FUNG|nr:hypothetical protein BDK51DRAFT_25601 [Blyttiomyces helicus]|eukprot:RKO90833.1 hypothetical protein BDK51DRAFT_25601 [Blyttiomyces helicus]